MSKHFVTINRKEFTGRGRGVRPLKGKSSLAQLLVLALYVSILFPFSAQAAEDESIPSYFADHFDQSVINDNWNVIEGSWAIDSGQLTVARGKGYKALVSGVELEDFTVESGISLGDRTGDAGILFRTVDATPGIDNVKGYYAGISATGSGAVILGRMNNGWTELKRASVKIDPNTTYQLKISAVGSQIRVYLNGSAVLEQSDSTYTKGSIGIRMYDSLPSYDHFTASSAEGQVVFDEPFDTPQEAGIGKWEQVDGSWSVRTGTLNVNKGDGYKIIARDAQFQDLTLETDLRLPEGTGTGDAGLLFRTQSAAAGADAVRGYYAGISGEGKVILGRMNNDWQQLKEVKAFDSMDPARFYHLKITAYQNQIKVYVNNTRTPVLEYTDESPAAYGKGGVGLRSYRAEAAFDHFIASEYVMPQQAPQEPVANKQPLVQTPFIPLPLGSVEAKGWLLKQLELQRDGATGYAEDLYGELGTNAAWLGGTAPDSDWERPVYYVKGLVALAYTLKDPDLIAKSQKWINAILTSQKADGSFGPSGNDDWWPRMVALYALKDYYEASQDARVLSFMTKYFQYQAEQLPARPLRDWGKIRVGDNIDTVLWLYNRTGDEFLLHLADLLADQGYPITDIFADNQFQGFGNDFQPTHAVNVNEAIKMPAVYYQRSHADKDRDAFQEGVQNLSNHNQITGMPSGTEMLAGVGSTQGVELCAITERMQSNEEAAMILGDPHIGDALEKIAFNSLPGAMDKELKNHQYYSLPNQVESDLAEHGYKQDYANGTMPSPTSGYPCCRFNMHMGWPYFVKNMWAATADGGLGVIAYGPSRVSTRLKNVNVSVEETTNYPFEDQIAFDVTASEAVQFPLKLRIPEWAVQPTVTVNGVPQDAVKAGEYMTIDRTWKTGDHVVLTVPMKLKTTTWINNSVGIERGPLVFSLKIEENWQTESNPLAPVPGFNPAELGFKQYRVKADSPWNYGLVIDREHPENSIEVVTGSMPENPFVQGETPIKLIAKAKKIPSWGKAFNNVEASEPPVGPFYSAEPTEEITLVPYGAENLRVTYFPEVTDQDSSVPSAVKYEAEQAEVSHADVRTNNSYASGGGYVGGMDYSDSYVSFPSVTVPKSGTYHLDIWFANGSDYQAAIGKMLVNGAEHQVTYQGTKGWGRFMAVPMEVELNEGANEITFMKGQGYYELDYMVVRSTEPQSEQPPEEQLSAVLSGADSVHPGETFHVRAGFTGVTENVYAQDLTFSYDPDALEFVSAAETKESVSVVASKQAPGQIRILLAKLGSDPMNGEVLDLQWRAKEDASLPDTAISLSNVVLADGTGAETQLDGVSHHVQIAAVVDKTALNTLIANAQGKHDAAVEGTRPGQYPAGSKAILQAAIDQAKAVSADAAATETEVGQMVNELNEALQAFIESVNTASPGDTNGDGTYSIGDLAIVAAAYGHTSAEPNWNQYKQADLNNNGAVDLTDLVIAAKSILQEN